MGDVKEIKDYYENSKRDEFLKIFADFWNVKVRKVKDLLVFVLMANVRDSHGATNSTVRKKSKIWTRIIIMTRGYHIVVKKIKLLIEDGLEMQEFNKSKAKINKSN
jgi:hypothetical protein